MPKDQHNTECMGSVWDLWDDPVGVAALLQQWTDAQGAAVGGTPIQSPLLRSTRSDLWQVANFHIATSTMPYKA